jgi:hypothetical protein
LKLEKDFRKPKLWKNVLGFSFDEDDFCKSETKCDIKVAPRLKVFVLGKEIA